MILRSKKRQKLFLVSFVYSIGTQKSSQKMYSELNDRIEQTSKLIYSILVKGSFPATIMPPIITSLVNFYILNLGIGSFELPFPTV